jgi:HD-like signal output (HDOD) protein
MTTMVETSARSLADQIREAALKGDLSLPPLPELATRVLDLLHDENRADSRRVADLVRTDQAVTATLLRMANSAAFGGLREVTDLSQAVTRLGLRHVGSVVTALVHKGNFETSDPAWQGLVRILWDHALACALAAKYLTSRSGGDPEEAYLAGLLHDTGKLVVLRGVDVVRRKGSEVPVTPVVMEELLDLLHAELGHRTLSRWKLPEPICRVALHHHDELQGSSDLLLVRVQAADAISRKIGAHPHPDPEMKIEENPAVERLGMDDLEMATVQVDVEDALAAIKQLV